jgi:hypothetical protein
MSRRLRKIALSLVASLSGVAVLLVLVGDRAPPDDCGVARHFYSLSEEDSFEKFLENVFRVFGVIGPGGLFSDPRYQFAMYHPAKGSYRYNRYKLYSYLISREGKPHSRMALSISKEEWESGTRVKCDER